MLARVNLGGQKRHHESDHLDNDKEDITILTPSDHDSTKPLAVIQCLVSFNKNIVWTDV